MVSHVGFSDESHWNTGRFRSLGLVTCTVDSLNELGAELSRLLKESGISEFSWKHLDGAKERFAAQKMCKFAVYRACANQLRADVLIWDIEDSRHKVTKRDDIANLERMYYHLFKNVLRARWPNDAIWRLHPDENTSMNWETVQDCLVNVGTRVEIDHSLFTRGEFRVRLRREFGIEEIQPVASGDHTLLQLADLFAGLAVFSRERFAEYHEWQDATSPQKLLFEQVESDRNPSCSSRERFQVLACFDDLCKRRRLGVSLKKKKGLWTPKPENPLNFWLYEAQHTLDIAPRRS